MQVKNKIDIKPVKKYLNRLEREIEDYVVRRALSKVVLEVRKDVIPKTPRDKGELVNSWQVEKKKFTIEAGFNLIYAMYQHQGRRQDGSHVIVNRPAGGETYWYKNSLERNKKKYQQIIVDEFKKIFKS